MPGLYLCGADTEKVMDDIIPAIKTLFKTESRMGCRGSSRDRNRRIPRGAGRTRSAHRAKARAVNRLSPCRLTFPRSDRCTALHTRRGQGPPSPLSDRRDLEAAGRGFRPRCDTIGGRSDDRIRRCRCRRAARTVNSRASALPAQAGDQAPRGAGEFSVEQGSILVMVGICAWCSRSPTAP